MTIVHQLAQPLRELGRVQEYWHGSRIALEKISDFLAAPSRLTAADWVRRHSNWALVDSNSSTSVSAMPFAE